MPDADRARFWPRAPDWTRARIEGRGVTVTAAHGDRGVYLLSGPQDALRSLAATHMSGVCACLLPIAPDRALMVTAPEVTLDEGWQGGVAVSQLSDAHVRIDVRGTAAEALLHRASPSLALAGDGPLASAAVAFAGVPVLVEKRPDGAKLHVELPLAPHVWHWLLAAISETEVHP